MKTVTILSIISFILLSCNVSTTNGKEFVNDSLKIKQELSDGTSLNILVVRGNLPQNGVFKNALMWGGDVGFIPKNNVHKIEILLGEKKVNIPLSAYVDLGYPMRATLEILDNNFSLKIKGGSASVSYTALLIFKDGRLKERLVKHNEFPDQVWTKTEYSWNVGEE